MAPNDIDRLRQGFSSMQVIDHIEATPPTPTTPTSRMHLLSGLRTAPRTQTPVKTRGYTHPNVNGVTNTYDYGVQSPNPRIVLSPNNNVEAQNYYATRPYGGGHKHQHSRGSSVSSLQIPKAPKSTVRRPDTPDSSPESFDPQLYASLQQQYLDLLATNQFLVQQHHQQQQQIQLQQQYNLSQQMAFLSPPRTPIPYQQYTQDSPSPYLSPAPERQRFQSPRRTRFESEEPTSMDPPARIPSPATSPSPASSESSWRRGHRRGKSSISINGNAPKVPQPIRQPYGPPPMETLLESKASGAQSANFASRLRRKAVNRLMQAGLERKGGVSPGPGCSFAGREVEEVDMGEDEFDPRRRSAMF